MAALGLHCCTLAFSSCSKWGLFFFVVSGLTIVVASFCCGAQAPECAGFKGCGTGPRLLKACGIFLDQGLNPCPLHWQVDSHPLDHQGSPGNPFLKCKVSQILDDGDRLNKKKIPLGPTKAWQLAKLGIWTNNLPPLRKCYVNIGCYDNGVDECSINIL